MLAEKNNKTVLVAPLDWGLGHATRCIPIIRELRKQGCRVLIASDGRPAQLLQQEFTDVEIILLKGYDVHYGKGNLMLELVRQLPRFLQSIRQEHRWLQEAIGKFSIDAVISDNRYGLYAAKIPAVFITHQLQLQAPAGLKWGERWVQKQLYHLIEKFDACWVPDAPATKLSLGMKLSHPAVMPRIPVTYIDWLTRFLPKVVAQKTYKLVISLSGPEPQRTLLEQLLIPQLSAVDGKVLFIRGLPGSNNLQASSVGVTLGVAVPEASYSHVTIVSHLSGTAMQQTIAESDYFISRCGYSTLMDLQAVTCRCIFIPTPGQTEQEYLGKEIRTAGKAVVLPQLGFNLAAALQQATNLPFFSTGNYINDQLGKVIFDWLNILRTT